MGEKILIVEDEDDLRGQYSEILRSAGYIVDEAENGEKGYEKIKQGGYDLILLDIIMPFLDGITVMKKISNEGTDQPNGSIIFLTNLDKDEEIKKALQLGQGYLIKSQITLPDLLNEVKLYLSQESAPVQE